MSDQSVRSALRSPDRLVIVEAPAGCGKTYHGSQYVHDIAASIAPKRVLVLTHTHAAADAFAAVVKEQRNIDIRTIDSLTLQIASAYHASLGLPKDVGSWASSQPDYYQVIAEKVAKLLGTAPCIARSLAARYPIIVCDEHQDADAYREAVVFALYTQGAVLRIFGDPMQRIFKEAKGRTRGETPDRWKSLASRVPKIELLDSPHRWEKGSKELGEWILKARHALCSGGQVDLRSPLPRGLQVLIADNVAGARNGYRLLATQSSAVYGAERQASSLLILAARVDTTEAIHAMFNRRGTLWEGHVRTSLSTLASSIKTFKGDPNQIGTAMVKFLEGVTTGFSRSQFGNRLLSEIESGCSKSCTGRPARLQEVGRMILRKPDHKGIADALARIQELQKSDSAFRGIHIDHRREFWEAINLGRFDDGIAGLEEITRRRTYSRAQMPAKTVSTIHKAKGLECSNVLLMAVDGKHFGDNEYARCLLYVAISRPKQSLTIVASVADPSPLLILPN